MATRSQRLDAIKQRVLQVNMGLPVDQRFDANEAMLFARQLESIDATLYEVQYPQLNWSEIVPVQNGISDGAETYTYQVVDTVGRAKLIGNYADDLPRADAFGREVQAKIKHLGASYAYSIQDMRRAKLSGVGIDEMRARAARRAIAEFIDEAVMLGVRSEDGTVLNTGFANNGSVSLTTVVTGTWATATGDQIVDDVLKMEREIITASKGVERPDTLALPPSRYAIASTKRMGSSLNDVTALEFLMKKSVGIRKVVQNFRLETAGASSVPRIVAYTANIEKVAALVPMEFNSLPPEARNLALIVNCEGRCGGVAWRLPGSARYMDGT